MALGVALGAELSVHLVTLEAELHPRSVGHGGELVVRDVPVAVSALGPDTLQVKLMVHDDFQRIIVVIGLLLQHALVAPAAVGVDTSIVRLKISRDQDRVVRMTLGAGDLLRVPG